MLNYDDVVLQIIALEKERNELRDLLCLYCGKEEKQALGVCAGCKWNDKRKGGDE